MPSRGAIVVAVAVAAIGLAALPERAVAAKAKKRPRSWIVSVATPAGLQGTAGAGGNVVIPFVVASVTGRRADVQAEYGTDVNADGFITDDEYRPITEDRFDSRNTRSDSAPQLYSTGLFPGAAAAYVWNSTADVGTKWFRIVEYALTQQGRFIPDPDNPGSYLPAHGPNGNEIFTGVRVRLRTFWRRTKPGRWQFSPWVESDAFVLDNTSTPSMTIDSVAEGSTMTVRWTAFDADSEDANGNGQLDIASGEDANNNSRLDCETMGVAFDWHRVCTGEYPLLMSDAQLASLYWLPCTRVPGAGDTDSLDARPAVPIPDSGDSAGVCSAPPGVGRTWSFAWNAVLDAGATPDGLILRATPFCEHRNRGLTVYLRTIVHTTP